MRTYEAFEQDALNFLRGHFTAVIATCLDGKAHASTVYYDVDSAFCFYYLTRQNTQKNIHVAFNPDVAVVVGTGPERITVQARGKAEMLVGEEKVRAIARMAGRYAAEGIETLPIIGMEELRGSGLVAYKVTPKEMVFMNMDGKDYPRSISNKYHQIPLSA